MKLSKDSFDLIKQELENSHKELENAKNENKTNFISFWEGEIVALRFVLNLIDADNSKLNDKPKPEPEPLCIIRQGEYAKEIHG